MPVQKIVVTRHGFRSNWDTHVVPRPPPTGIDGDPPLSAHGVEQSNELCAHLASLEPRIDQIYASPFYRCVETIYQASDRLGLPIYCENGFGEWYGRTRQTHPSPASRETLNTFFCEVDVSYEPLFVPSTQGETKEELHERAKMVLQKLIAKLNKEQPSINTIAICSHAATIIALGRALIGDDSCDIRTGTCSVSIYEADPHDNGLGKWKCAANGSAKHLSNGEERHWSFEQGQYDFLDVQAYDVQQTQKSGK